MNKQYNIHKQAGKCIRCSIERSLEKLRRNYVYHSTVHAKVSMCIFPRKIPITYKIYIIHLFKIEKAIPKSLNQH